MRTLCNPLRLACAALLASLAISTPAQQPITPAPPDPAVAAALGHISPDQIHADIAKLVSFNNRSTLSSMDTDLPPGTGVLAAADWITAEFTRISAACGNCLEVKRDDFIEPPQKAVPGGPVPRIVKPTRIVNVYAVLKGSDPAQAARRVLVTGHYDSRNSTNENTHDAAPGANDDASGVAVSLECARARTASGIKFPATLVFVAVAGDEQGLNGSVHLARLAKSEGWQLEAVLNNDIVGGDTTPGDEAFENKDAVRVFSDGVPDSATLAELHAIQTIGAENDSPSRELARAVVDVASSYFLPTEQHAAPAAPGCRPKPPRAPGSGVPSRAHLPPRPLPARWRSHQLYRARLCRYPFYGVAREFRPPAPGRPRCCGRPRRPMRATGSAGPDDQFGDLLQFVDPAYVANVARLNAAALATFALAPDEPQRVRVQTNNLDNNTQLTWEPPAGQPAAASYEIVWRATDAPDWVSSQAVAHGTTSITLPISKDNTIFGVRSVDPAGHRSPAVYPVPTRSRSLPHARTIRSSRGRVGGVARTMMERAMPRSSMPISFPPFAGTVRKLVFANVAIFFAVMLLQLFVPDFTKALLDHLVLTPGLVARGQIWQLVTYCFLHFGILDILFTMITLWFCGSLLEGAYGSRWLRELYFASAIGGAILASIVSFTKILHMSPDSKR